METPPTTESSKSEGATSFADRIKQARDERGFTQGAVANRTKMFDPDKRGISRTALIGYEQGTSNPGLREIRLLCEVLAVTPNWLIFGTDSAVGVSHTASELLKRQSSQLAVVLRTALALTVLKGHEREALQSLVLSLVGRQLGDLRLSGLLSLSDLMEQAFFAQLKAFSSNFDESKSLEEIAEAMSYQFRTNFGNKLKLDEEGDPIGGEWTYPDPKGTAKWKP
ncbi:MAG: helix-turn-helix transcriptional regulator [Burkholderiales bacterium]|nr:helix-turn-helix transcriptional regulator [Burkholderiales bacterium]